MLRGTEYFVNGFELYMKIFFAIAFFFAASSAFSQGKDTAIKNDFPHANNLLSFEFLGNGGVYALNYERFLSEVVSAGIGASWLPLENYPNDGKAWFHTTPGIVMFSNYYFFRYLEIGAALDFLLDQKQKYNISIFNDKYSSSNSSVLLSTRLGFRWTPQNRSDSYSIALTPFLSFKPLAIRFWLGISAGYFF
jgi:hypothetical protein